MNVVTVFLEDDIRGSELVEIHCFAVKDSALAKFDELKQRYYQLNYLIDINIDLPIN